MKIYQYKIQWIFSVVTENRDLNKVIKILGSRSLTKIVFRNSELKIIGEWSSMVQYPNEVADDMTIRQIKLFKKKNPETAFVELYRK